MQNVRLDRQDSFTFQSRKRARAAYPLGIGCAAALLIAAGAQSTATAAQVQPNAQRLTFASPSVQAPGVVAVHVVARSEHSARCVLTGNVARWTYNDMESRLIGSGYPRSAGPSIRVGLVQFSDGSTLNGCLDGIALDLSGQFARSIRVEPANASGADQAALADALGLARRFADGELELVFDGEPITRSLGETPAVLPWEMVLIEHEVDGSPVFEVIVIHAQGQRWASMPTTKRLAGQRRE